MRIFEGHHRETAKDITFGYNADFFLYASLHHSPDGHPGRVSPQSGPPVLTGMPVSSMILLDRPEEAGYFIFSDLSVRHEGQYYLNFALMEEVKRDDDKDPDEYMADADEISGPESNGSGRSFCFRTTVTTDVFDVFSAKRFPGLQESTALSRTVAEQGCRVRIRRDVRMRRRPAASKNKGDNGTPNPSRGEAAGKARADAPRHPQAATNENNAQYDAELKRRQSAREYPPRMEYPQARQSFSGSEASVGRAHPYGQLPPYGPDGQSLPSSPSYPPPPAAHGSQFDPRSSYSSYTDRSPTHPYAPSGPTSRDNYTHRAPRPVLAPKLEVDDSRPTKLPPICNVYGSSQPRVLPQLPQHRPISPRELGSLAFGSKSTDYQPQLPPVTGAYGVAAPLTPLTPSPGALSNGSRKRTADEAALGHGPNGDGSSRHGSYSQPGPSRRESYAPVFRDYNSAENSTQQSPSSQAFPGHNANGERTLRQCSSSFASASNIATPSIATSKCAPATASTTLCSSSSNHGPMLPSEYYRLQTSQNEQPRVDSFGAMESDYRVSYPRSEPYIMSTPIYNRASDAPMQVYFPDLHA